MADVPVVPVAKNQLEVDFNCNAIGKMRSTGEMICLLLSLDRDEAEEIVADVIKTMGLSEHNIIGWLRSRPCKICGMATFLHGRDGRCP